MQELVIYDAACRALSLARTVDDVKDILNRAEAARAYARQAQNRQLEVDAAEIRVRAERRLGGMILDLKKSGLGIQGRHAAGADPADRRISLRTLGISAAVCSASQRLAQLPDARFEGELRVWRCAALAPRGAGRGSRNGVPLQQYRLPSSQQGAVRVQSRRGSLPIEAADPLDKFRAPDGRRIADWRVGELDRLEDVAIRFLTVARAIRAQLPVVQDPLVTMEMVFSPAELLAIFAEAWQPLSQANAGLRDLKTKSAGRRAGQAKPQHGARAAA